MNGGGSVLMRPLMGAIPSPEGVDVGGGELAGSRLLAGLGSRIDPRPVDLFGLHLERVQQVQDCVSHARANLVQVLIAQRTGRPPRKLSVAYSYAGAQHLWSPGNFPDTGSSCLLTLKWWRDHGCVLEEAYPETAENCTRVPPDDLWASGSGATMSGSHRIAGGAGSAELLCAALGLAEQGIATSSNVVITVDDAFAQLEREGVLEAPNGAVLGGHDLACLAFDPKRGSDPRGAFGFADTWGRFRVWLTWGYVEKYGREMLVSEAAPVGEVQ